MEGINILLKEDIPPIKIISSPFNKDIYEDSNSQLAPK